MLAVSWYTELKAQGRASGSGNLKKDYLAVNIIIISVHFSLECRMVGRGKGQNLPKSKDLKGAQ
jgi:hypothetical protein